MVPAHGLDVNAVNSRWRTTLSCAARSGSAQVIELLVTLGADVNAPANVEGETVMRNAVRDDLSAGVETLIALGSNLRETGASENTLLHTSASWGSLNSMRLLLAEDIDVKALDYCDMTALHTVAEGSDMDEPAKQKVQL